MCTSIHQVNKNGPKSCIRTPTFPRLSQRCSQILGSTHTKYLLEQFSVIALGLMSMNNTKWDIAHIKLQWALWTYDAISVFFVSKNHTSMQKVFKFCKTLGYLKCLQMMDFNHPKTITVCCYHILPLVNQLSSSYSYEWGAECVSTRVELSWLWVMRGLLTKRRASRRESVCQAWTAATTTVNKAGASTHGNTIGTHFIIFIILLLLKFFQIHSPRPPLQCQPHMPLLHLRMACRRPRSNPICIPGWNCTIVQSSMPQSHDDHPALLYSTDPPRIHNPFKLSPHRSPQSCFSFKYFQRCPNAGSSPPLTITYFHAV